MAGRTILVPLDGSSLAEGALPYAEAIARLTGASLHLVCVYGDEDESLTGSWKWLKQQLDEGWRADTEAYLNSVAVATHSRGVEVSVEAIVGSVAQCILDAAASPAVRMVVMSTHGVGGAKRMLVGGIADKVMRLATCPTLLIRSEEAAGPRTTVSLRRILVPLDGSPLAELAIEPAVALAHAGGATLVLVRAERSLWQTPAAFDGVANLTEIDDQVTRSIDAYLAGMRAKLPAEMKIELLVRREIPTTALEAVALNEHIDLVVMATHGRGGLSRLVLGSMADRMVRLGTATLLIRADAAGQQQQPTAVAAAPAG